MLVTKEAMAHLGIPMKNATVAVQGFGNVGSITAKLLAAEGCKITHIGDKDAAFHNAKGFDIPKTIAYVQKHRTLAGLNDGDEISMDDLLIAEVDILVPAALENVITKKNAPNVRAKLITEGANGPITAPAEAILDEKGIVVIPDILANAGGVTVSYFEWVQDRMGYFWSEADVNSRLTDIMTRSFQEVLALSKQHRVNMRTAAYMLSINRVATVHRLRGIYA